MHHNFVNPIKQTAAGPQPLYLLLSCSRLSTSNSHPTFTASLSLGISKPSTSSSRTQVGMTLICVTWETPEPVHTVDSYRPHWRTTTLSLHSRSSMEGGGWWSVVTANSHSWLALVNPSLWPANSNQGSTTRRECTQPTQRAHLEYPAWVIGEAVPLDPTGHPQH